MLKTPAPATPRSPQGREARVQAILRRLRPHADRTLRQMAERLADLPDDQAFGQVEYDLRDLARELAASAHQAGLDADKKRGTSAPASPAPTARPTPASSSTAPRPS
jgi:hypothetical protein